MTSIAATAATTSSSTATAKSATLDQASFLKLMTTQLQTQDPFNPVDNTQMVAQMAQFSSVAGIAEMNASLKDIAASLTGSRLGEASGWIGKSALLPSTAAAARVDGSYAGTITLPAAASKATLSLVDANGAVVHTQSLGPQPAGSVDFAWDGRDAGGAPVAGPLTVVVSAQDAGGAAIAADIATWTTVSGIRSPAGGSATRLVTPIGAFAPADAQSLG